MVWDSIIAARTQAPLLFLPYSTQCAGDVSSHSHKMAARGPGIRSSCHSSKQQGRGYDEVKENLVFFYSREKSFPETVPFLLEVG